MSRKSLLILMRHAKSDWPDEVRRDADRPLARRGERDAPRMGRWLRKNGLIPDKLISSPALRARATAEIVAEKLRIRKKRIVLDERIYEAGLRRLLEVVAGHGADSSTLLLIGHNPGLEELLLHLASDPVARNDRGKLMTTAAAAVLEFRGRIGAERRSARLLHLVRPKDLKASATDSPDGTPPVPPAA
ncbi:MAG: histidine phosphatase family protein [Gammaproteobacteria bacterium]|nr:histidine phosphatase family protein [Gammaproteobacteria bacterium]